MICGCITPSRRRPSSHDLIVLADEIYTDYMYTIPFAPLRGLEGMDARTITLNSFSKNYIMTGWRIGYIIAPTRVVDAMRRINENLVYSAPSISQRAALHALRLREEIGDRYVSAYKERVFYCARRIGAIPKLSVRAPEGTFYLFMNVRQTRAFLGGLLPEGAARSACRHGTWRRVRSGGRGLRAHRLHTQHGKS